VNINHPRRQPSPPLVFKLDRRLVAQRGVDSLLPGRPHDALDNPSPHVSRDASAIGHCSTMEARRPSGTAERGNPPGRPLFVNTFGREIGRDDPYHMVPRIQDRAGVVTADVHLKTCPQKGRRPVSALTSPSILAAQVSCVAPG